MIRRRTRRLRSRQALLLATAGAITVPVASASGVDKIAQYCLGPTAEHRLASLEECLPLRPIPDDDNTYDEQVDAQTATEDLGQVCLELMQGPPGSLAMLEITFKTSQYWVMTDAHFWLGSRVEDAPTMMMNLHDNEDPNADQPETDADPSVPSTARSSGNGSQDENYATTTYTMPDSSRFPYYTTMEDAEDSRLRTTTEWNEVIEATPEVVCPSGDNENKESQELRFFSAQAILRPKATKDGSNSKNSTGGGLRPIVAFAAMQQEESFRSLDSFFVTCACPGSLDVDGKEEKEDSETETAEEVEEEAEQDDIKSNNLLNMMFADDERENEQEEQAEELITDESEAEEADEETKEDEFGENNMLEQVHKEEQFEELQEWKLDHNNAAGDETQEEELEDETKQDAVSENYMLEQMQAAEQMEEEQVGDTEEGVEDETKQDEAGENNMLEQEKIDEQLEKLAEEMEEDRKTGKEHAEEDYVEVQEGQVDRDSSEDEAEAVIVNADELEFTTSFIVVVPDQKHYMDVLLDENNLHATESKIEASPGLHKAWHTFVGQLMGDFNVPSINSTDIRGAVKSEKDLRRDEEDDPVRRRNLKTVTIEWIEDSPDLFNFLIMTPCPASVLHMLGKKKKRGKQVVDMGSSPKELIRAGSGQDSTFDEATCYKAFGKYKVVHLKDPIDGEEMFQDLEDVGSSRQEACYDIFHMTRLALAKDRLGQDLPDDAPFLIHGGKPESCLPTGFATTVVKPAGLTGIDLTSGNATNGVHRSKDPLYDLHNEDGSWNILKVLELVAYVSTSMLMMSLCIVIYCYFLPKIDMECRNQVTDDWSQPSMRPTRIVGSRRGKPKAKEMDYFPWLE